MGKWFKLWGGLIIVFGLLCMFITYAAISYYTSLPDWLAILLAIAVCFGLVVPGMFLYGFGQIIEDVRNIRDNVRLLKQSEFNQLDGNVDLSFRRALGITAEPEEANGK